MAENHVSCMLGNYTEYRDKFRKEAGRSKVHTTLELLRVLFTLAKELKILEQFRGVFDSILKELIEDSKSALSDCAGLETSIMKYIYEVEREQNDVSVKLVYTEGDMRCLSIHKDNLFTMLMECEMKILQLVEGHVTCQAVETDQSPMCVMCLNKEDVINAMKGIPSSSNQPVQEPTANIASLDDSVDKKPLNHEGTVYLYADFQNHAT